MPQQPRVIEEIKLQNTTTRRAFYNVRLLDTKSGGRPYKIEISWGRMGTAGRTITKRPYATEEKARIEMHKLVEAKKMRHYYEGKPNEQPKKVKSADDSFLKEVTAAPSLERFMYLELE